MKKTLIPLVFLIFALAPHLAKAMMASSFFIEPSVGYRNETIRLTDLSNQQTQMKSALPVYGLKLGYRSAIGVDFNLAGEYSKGKLEIGSLAEKSDFAHQNASVQLGVNALGLLKIYLGYAFLNDFKIDDSTLLTGFKLNGPAYIAGLQLRLFPMLNLGLQYNLNQFNKISGSAYTLGEDTEKYFSKIDSQDYSLYLSLAF